MSAAEHTLRDRSPGNAVGDFEIEDIEPIEEVGDVSIKEPSSLLTVVYDGVTNLEKDSNEPFLKMCKHRY